MTEKEFIELKDRIANSIYEQINSERSTFKKKDLLYVATQVRRISSLRSILRLVRGIMPLDLFSGLEEINVRERCA